MRVSVGVAEQYGKTLLAADSVAGQQLRFFGHPRRMPSE